MNSARLRIAAVAVAVAVATTANAQAGAPSKKECIDANAQAQTQQKEGRLRAAQSSLQLCTSPQCPGAVRDDCAQRLDDLERRLPTLVFEAKDAAGADLTAVRVLVDGQPLAEKLDGTALAVDPGEHTFAFEVAGHAPVSKKLVIREGDRGRRERITFGPASASQPTPLGAPPPPAASATSPGSSEPVRGASDSETPGNGRKTAGIVLGISGIVGLGVGGLFAGLASSSWSSSQRNCSSASDCPNRADAVSDHDSAVSSATVSTIAFVAGGALLAAGLVVYFTAPKDSAPTAAIRVVPSVGGAIMVGSF